MFFVGCVASAMGERKRGLEVSASLRARAGEIAARAAGAGTRPTMACVEWIDPLMAAGNWVPELVEIAGGQNLLSVAGQHSPWLTWQQLLEADPEVIVVLPCGFDLARTRHESEDLRENPQWKQLRAVTNRKVFLADGHHCFNRPGPRLVESAEILAEILHPDVFPPNRENTGWERM